jgi:hypothetical protein
MLPIADGNIKQRSSVTNGWRRVPLTLGVTITRSAGLRMLRPKKSILGCHVLRGVGLLLRAQHL